MEVRKPRGAGVGIGGGTRGDRDKVTCPGQRLTQQVLVWACRCPNGLPCFPPWKAYLKPKTKPFWLSLPFHSSLLPALEGIKRWKWAMTGVWVLPVNQRCLKAPLASLGYVSVFRKLQFPLQPDFRGLTSLLPKHSIPFLLSLEIEGGPHFIWSLAFCPLYTTLITGPSFFFFLNTFSDCLHQVCQLKEKRYSS